MMNRREFVQTTGYAALGMALASNLPASAQSAAPAAPGAEFDINSTFAGFMRDLGATPADGGGKVRFTGQDPILRSHFRIGAAMALPAMGAEVGAAAIWRERTGEGQDLTVDLRESVYNVNPIIGAVMRMSQAAGKIPAADPLPANFNFLHPSVDGLFLQAPVGLGNPMTFVPFETKDGRFFNITGAYPHLERRGLQALNVPPGRDNIVRGFKGVDSFEFEERLNEMGGVGVVHRSDNEWLAHPEGAYLAKVPLIEIIKIGDSAPESWLANATQPLSGIKVMANTHVIAGTVSARTLAEYGAQVLHVARDQAFEHEALVVDVNVGVRSTFADLRNPDQNKRLKALVPQADVHVENYRVGTLDRMAEPELLTAQTPYGLVRRLGPQVKLSKTPGPWRTPLVAVRGGDTVNWV
jgi:hypothetical protein